MKSTSERANTLHWIGDWLWFLFWAAASSYWCWTAARQLGATFDEPIYIQRGLEFWRSGSHQAFMKMGTMPLPIDVQTLPLYLWEKWQGVRLDPIGNLDPLLPWARAGNLVFWWLLLIYGRLAARQIGGPWAGRLAVALLACEPNLLAHASLATTDIAIAACLLALVYHYRNGRVAGWPRRVGLPIFWFAAAVLAKASAIVFVPLCLVIVEIERRINGGQPAIFAPQIQSLREKIGDIPQFLSSTLNRPFRRDLLQIMVGGMCLVFIYCGSDWQPQASFVAWANRLPDGTSRQTLVWLAEHLTVFSNAGEGLVRQIKHNMQGHSWYLLGQSGTKRSVWYYFPVALTIKLSLPLLILPIILAVVRPRVLLNWACLAAGALLLLSITYRVQIGIRLMLPFIVLAVVGLAAAAMRAAQDNAEESASTATEQDTGSTLRGKTGRAPLFMLCAGLIWMATSAISLWPHGLCYINELWGGPQRGYLLLSDSNYDWGQGVPDLARWQRQHPAKPLTVWYFGSDPAIHKLPAQILSLHTLPIQSGDDVKTLVRGRYLAVSTTLLYGGYIQGDAPVVAWLRRHRPVDRTMTFLIYDFTQ